MTAGYSGTPLARKLGITEGMVVGVRRPPEHLAALLEPLPHGARLAGRLPTHADLLIDFVSRRAELVADWPVLTPRLPPAGALWVAWPKRASKLPTDVTEDVVRNVVLPTGWVDVKVCAVDETWSALKCVLRKELRPR